MENRPMISTAMRDGARVVGNLFAAIIKATEEPTMRRAPMTVTIIPASTVSAATFSPKISKNDFTPTTAMASAAMILAAAHG